MLPLTISIIDGNNAMELGLPVRLLQEFDRQTAKIVPIRLPQLAPRSAPQTTSPKTELAPIAETTRKFLGAV